MVKKFNPLIPHQLDDTGTDLTISSPIISGTAGRWLTVDSSSNLFQTAFWVDVKAYGATGDGTTDDSAAIQQAFNALPSNGGGIYFPPGDYLINSSITSTNRSLNIRGAGVRATNIICPITKVFDFGTSASNTDRFFMENLSFGLSTNVWYANGVVRLIWIRDFQIKNVEFKGNSGNSSFDTYAGYLLELDSSYQGTLENVRNVGRYTYLSEMNVVSKSSEQCDNIIFQRCESYGFIGSIFRSGSSNFNDICFQDFKHVPTAETQDDDETTLSAGVSAGDTVLSVADSTNFDANDPVLIGNGLTVEVSKIASKSVGSITLSTGLRYAHSSGAKVIHGAVSFSFDSNTYNSVISGGHFEFTAIVAMLSGTPGFLVENVYSSSRDVVRIVGTTGLKDLVVRGGSYEGNTSTNNIVHVMAEADVSDLSGVNIVGPLRTIVGGTTIVPYVNDGGTDRRRRNILVSGGDLNFYTTGTNIDFDVTYLNGVAQHTRDTVGNYKMTGNLAVGLGTPTAKIHQDSGTGTATYHKFTAGSTTGQTSSDGFDIGIDASGNAEIRQRENLPLTFYTNNSSVARFQAIGRFTVGDVTEGSPFFTNYAQKMLVNTRNTTYATDSSTFTDLLQLMCVSSVDIDPSANTGSGLGATIYAAQGYTTDVEGNKTFTGLAVAGSQISGEPLSAFGAFGQVNINTTGGTLDGAVGLLCTVNHSGLGGNANFILASDFNANTDGSIDSTPTGTVTTIIGGRFTVTLGGVSATNAISGRFVEPDTYDPGFAPEPSQPTNKTAIDLRGTLSILDSDVATAASITNMAVETSVIRMTGSTATDIHGIHADTFNKMIWIYNVSSATVTLKHQSATDGTAANRIICNTGADVAITTGKSVCLWYDDNQSRWIHLFNS